MRIPSGCLFSPRLKVARYIGHRHSRHVSRSIEEQKWVPISRRGTSLPLGKKVSLFLPIVRLISWQGDEMQGFIKTDDLW